MWSVTQRRHERETAETVLQEGTRGGSVCAGEDVCVQYVLFLSDCGRRLCVLQHGLENEQFSVCKG